MDSIKVKENRAFQTRTWCPRAHCHDTWIRSTWLEPAYHSTTSLFLPVPLPYRPSFVLWRGHSIDWFRANNILWDTLIVRNSLYISFWETLTTGHFAHWGKTWGLTTQQCWGVPWAILPVKNSVARGCRLSGCIKGAEAQQCQEREDMLSMSWYCCKLFHKPLNPRPHGQPLKSYSYKSEKNCWAEGDYLSLLYRMEGNLEDLGVSSLMEWFSRT